MNDVQEIDEAQELIGKAIQDLEFLKQKMIQLHNTLNPKFFEIDDCLDRLSEDFAQIEDYFDRSK